MLTRLWRAITATETSASFGQQVVQLLGWLGILSIGTFTSWEAAMTKWIAEYGPIAYITSGLLASLMAAIILYIVSQSLSAIWSSRLARSYSERGGRINPLKSVFEDEIIDVADFYSPGPMIYKNKVFRRCQIRGPGAIYMHGTFPNGMRLSHCTGHVAIVETPQQRLDPTAIVVFEDSAFDQCTFWRVTMIGAIGLQDRMNQREPT